MSARLSGGEQQRVAIAGALANTPHVLLADEPTASLDSQRAKQVMELFAHFTHEQNAGVIVVTHDHRFLDVFDTVYELEEACGVSAAELPDLNNRSNHRKPKPKPTFDVTSRRIDEHGGVSRGKQADIYLDTDLAGNLEAFNPAHPLLRMALGMLQMVAAIVGIVLLLTLGIHPVSLSVVAFAGALLLISVLLFRRLDNRNSQENVCDENS